MGERRRLFDIPIGTTGAGTWQREGARRNRRFAIGTKRIRGAPARRLASRSVSLRRLLALALEPKDTGHGWALLNGYGTARNPVAVGYRNALDGAGALHREVP